MVPMPRRYYSAAPIEGPSATLGGAEAHHLLHVLRAKPGDRVVLFDGLGAEFDAEVGECQRAEVVLAVGPPRHVQRELACSLTVGSPLPKSERLRWLVEKMVELGVTTFVPLATARSTALRRGDEEKMRRYVIEASKQCGRNRLMEIAAPCHCRDWLVSGNTPRQLIAHPGGKSLREVDLGQAMATCLAIGPEGGLTDDEVQTASDAGWLPVDLGPRILRIETAAAVLAAAIALVEQ